MRASVGDVLRFTGRKVGTAEHHATVIEVLGSGGEPPYKVRYDDGHITEIFPGTGCIVDTSTSHQQPSDT
ncbi:DUF1918 domain-containing protein [Streptomyces sp900105245]|uniref:DUF1918 domain-containing protein n=1 Tax=Streptomyces sp. 900105245 TaxID=3154379 RepID=A0ABV1ULH3_9ACTN